MHLKDANIALVHDWFLENSIGGAEKVTFLIDKYLTNNLTTPDLFAITENLSTSDKNFFKGRNIKTSFIQKLPFGKHQVRNYLPLLPFAVEQINFEGYDLIFSSSHIAAKGIITAPNQLHISYIHTPMRYAWDQMPIYIKRSKLSKIGLEWFIRYILFNLRQWDFLSGSRPDYLIANSSFTSLRIKKYWGKDSEVIHPPVNVERFNFNSKREDFYLSVNRLVPNKRVDILIKAFNRLGLPLLIIGEGPEKNSLKRIAKQNIIFIKDNSNSTVEELTSKCRAFVYAGIEDFGIAPVEAMAAGAPVIAYKNGGVLDTVKCLSNSFNKVSTGILFDNQTSTDVFNTIKWFEENEIWKKFNSCQINEYAQNFNLENFNTKLENFIYKSWDSFKKI